MSPDLLSALFDKPVAREPRQTASDDRREAFAALLDAERRSEDRALTRDGRDEVRSAVRSLLGDRAGDIEIDRSSRITVEIDGETRDFEIEDLAAAARAALDGDDSEVADLLGDLIETLNRLGDDPGEDLLGKLDGLLDELAAALGIQLPQTTDPDTLARLGGLQLEDGAGASDKLMGTLADMARQMLAGAGENENLTALAGKLAGLAEALDSDGGAMAKIAALLDGTNAKPADPVLLAGLESLTRQNGAPKPEADAQPASPESAETEGDEDGEARSELRLTELGRRSDGNAANSGNTNQNAESGVRAAVLASTAPDTADQAPDDLLGQLATQTGTRVEALPGARPVAAGLLASQQQINLPQVAFEVARQVQQGNTQFQIRLDPPDLGRIDVKLDFDNNGHVHARLSVEKSETLDMMMRDQRTLERALAQAGLDSTKTSLEFSLSQNGFAGRDGNEGGGQPGLTSQAAGGEAEVPSADAVTTLYRGTIGAGSVNIVA